MTNTQTHKTNRRLGRRTLVVMALGVAALMAVPASGFAATSFGAKLNRRFSRRTRCRRSPAP